jgi:hypothetical protein
MRFSIYFFVLVLVTGCTYRELPLLPVNKDVKGVWTVEQVYSNDYWGGPLYWRNTDWGKQIKFTPDLKYYQRTNGDFELIGSYKIVSEKNLEITWDKPLDPQHPTYQINYEFDNSDHLTISTGTYEGVVLEKYKLSQRL